VPLAIAILWDVAGKKERLRLGTSPPFTGKGLAWSRDGKRLATSNGHNGADIWNTETADNLLTLTGHSQPVTSIAWSADGKRIATGSSDHTAKIWDSQHGGIPLTLTGHEGDVFAIAWSPDGSRLATGSSDHTVKVWD